MARGLEQPLRAVHAPLGALLWLDRRIGDRGASLGAIAVLVVQQLTFRLVSGDGFSSVIRTTVVFASTGALVLLALHFRRFVGAWLVSLGIFFNLLAMAANGGLMPVAYEDVQGHHFGRLPEITSDDIGKRLSHSKDVVLLRQDIRLRVFSDQHLVKMPIYGENIYSLGDFVLAAGLVLAAVQGIVGSVSPGGRSRRHTEQRLAVSEKPSGSEGGGG